MSLAAGQPAPSHADAPAVTRDRVLDAALAMVEADGIDGITMRELAARLGVAVTAIYWHVGNKQTLLDELADRVIASLGAFEVTGTTPEARMLSVARSLRQKLLDQSHLFGLVHAQGRNAVLFRPARDLVAAELARCGYEGAEAALAVQALMQHVVGSVLLQQVVDRGPAPEDEPVDPDELFEFGVQTLVRALTQGPDARMSDFSLRG
jgi:TetR/AcrR family transcriptional regulator, tetracycline repressor protein